MIRTKEKKQVGTSYVFIEIWPDIQRPHHSSDEAALEVKRQEHIRRGTNCSDIVAIPLFEDKIVKQHETRRVYQFLRKTEKGLSLEYGFDEEDMQSARRTRIQYYAEDCSEVISVEFKY